MNDLATRLAPFALRYAERKALEAGDPLPALRGARRRATAKVVLLAVLGAWMAAITWADWHDRDVVMKLFMAWFTLYATGLAVKCAFDRRRLTTLLDELGAR